MSKDFRPSSDALVCPFIKKILSEAHKVHTDLISISVDKTIDDQVAVFVEYFICLSSPNYISKLMFFPQAYFENMILKGKGDLKDLTSDQSFSDTSIHFRLKQIGVEVLDSL